MVQILPLGKLQLYDLRSGPATGDLRQTGGGAAASGPAFFRLLFLLQLRLCLQLPLLTRVTRPGSARAEQFTTRDTTSQSREVIQVSRYSLPAES